MVQKVAPYLTVDSDPYPIVDDATGHVVWMVDGYTTMANYPYSERQSLSSLTSDSLSARGSTAQQPNDTINYIRNSVKATVDAFTGQVTLYAWDPTDPLLQAWMKIFPGKVLPKEAMPSTVLAHVRYPEDLFEAQRATLASYHVDNPVTFYNASDKWTVPVDPASPVNANQPPYYVLAAPADGSSQQAQFQLTTPMKVNNRTYMAAYMSVDSDPGPDYGKFTVLTLPSEVVIQGPEQVFNTFNSDPVISPTLTLLSGGGSQIIHGNLLTLPVGDSFLYVAPLYVRQAGTSAYPVLRRVMVSYGDRIGYAATLAEALSDLLPGHVTGQTLASSGASTPSGTTPTPTQPSGTATPTTPGSSSAGPPSQQALLAQLNTAYSDLQQAYSSGNAARIGQAQQNLNDLVLQYLSQFGSSAPSSPAESPSPGASPTH
jgi:uncharacterized membrane protein (UPF0182 family)